MADECKAAVEEWGEKVNEDLIWPVLSAFFRERHVNESKLQSYNQFVTKGLPALIKRQSPIHYKPDNQNQWHIFEIKQVTMNKPVATKPDGTSHPLYPKEARLRSESYTSDVYLNLVYSTYKMDHGETVSAEEVMKKGHLMSRQAIPYVRCMKFPVMVGSILCHTTDATRDYGECVLDSGGYFIINGGEKMLMYCERLAYNQIGVYPKKNASFTHYAEVRSEHPMEHRSTNTLYMMVSKQTKTEAASLYISGINSIPVVTFLRALGCRSTKEMFTRLKFSAKDRWCPLFESIIGNTLRNHQGITNRATALARIGRLAPVSTDKSFEGLRNAGMTYLQTKFLPHCGKTEADFLPKIREMCDIACALIELIKSPSLKTDKDSYFNKRTEGCEELLGRLSRQLFDTYVNGIKGAIGKRAEKKKSIPVEEIFSDNKVGKGLCDSLASGMWHASRDRITQTGVSQKMERMNYIATQAQHTKIINTLLKEAKQTGPRLLHGTSFGTVCPSDSPEGATCGLVKHNALMQHQSMGTHPATLIHLLLTRLKIVPLAALTPALMEEAIETGLHEDYVVVTVNNKPIGYHDNAAEVAAFVRRMRRTQTVSTDTGVSFTANEVHIRTDGGRNMRYLFVKENLWKLVALTRRTHGQYRWWDLINEQIVEAVDKEEEQNLLIAKDVETANDEKKKKPQSDIALSHPESPAKSTLPSLSSRKRSNPSLLVSPPPQKVGKVVGVAAASPSPSSSSAKTTRKRVSPFSLVPDEYSHVEIHGSVIWGVSASFIPFANHDQAPRNTYQCAMGRQAQALHSSNAIEHRMDISLLDMCYAQRPLGETMLHRILKCHKFPSGQNMMVAVISAGKNGQEDAHIMNRSSADRGMARSMAYRVVHLSERRHGKQAHHLEEFKRVDKSLCVNLKRGDYSQLDDDGIISVGARATNGTVLAQKVMLLSASSASASASASATAKVKKGGKRKAAAETAVTASLLKHKAADETAAEAAVAVKRARTEVESWRTSTLLYNDPGEITSRIGGGDGGEKSTTRAGDEVDTLPKWRDHSVTLQNTEYGDVDKVMLTSTHDNVKTCRIRYSKVCIPVLGDKFSTRYGQKGTLGLLASQEDMWWTEDGLTPDLIINSLAFAGRMTWGEWLETLFAIVCAINGRIGNATPMSHLYRESLYKTMEERRAWFKEDSIAGEIGAALHHLGMDPKGERVMYNAITGERAHGRFLFGGCYVQKLKHMAPDKLRARGRGRMQAQVRQPENGRTSGGGLKLGEMERDCYHAHGAAANIRDRMCLSSDATPIHICKVCSNTAIVHEETNMTYCSFCDRQSTALQMTVPYAFKLFSQELRAIGMNLKMHAQAETVQT